MSVSTGALVNPGVYREKVESMRVPRKMSGPVPKNGRMSVSTGTLLNPDEYRKTIRKSLEKC